MSVPFVDTAGGVCTPIAFVAAKGAITGDTELVVRDQPNLHVVKLATWNDDSWKHFAVVGLADLASGDNSIVLETGTPDGSSPPTVTKPTDVVSLGGTDLALADATLHRTWFSTPDMIETHYVAKSGTMYVWWYLRTWSDGKKWLGYKIENNRSPDDSTDAFSTFTDTVSVGGFDNDGDPLTLYANRAFYWERWINPSDDPGTTYKHDPLALSRCKLVENWIRRDNGWDEDNTNAYTTFPTAYEPLSRGNHFADWSGGGYKPHLGIHSKWEATMAKYADSRGMAGGKINALCLASYPVAFRDPSSKNPPKPTQIGVRGSPAIKYPDPPEADTLVWDTAHNVNSGYVPYLLTGDFRYWEQMCQHSAAIVYFTSVTGANSATRSLPNGETRGLAWQYRQFGQMLAVAPEEMGHSDLNAIVGEYRTLLAANMGYWYDAGVNGVVPAGIISDFTIANPLGIGFCNGLVSGLYQSNFMMGYAVFAVAHILDVEACSDVDNTASVRPLMQFVGQYPVNVLGPGGTGYFDWTQAMGNPLGTRYWQVVSSIGSVRPDFEFVYDDWGEVYFANWGGWSTPGADMIPVIADDGITPFTVPGSTIYATNGSWVLHAISKCVDYAVPGANAAFARLVGAGNFDEFGGDGSANGNGTYDEYEGYGPTPTEGIVPRLWADGVQPVVPTWFSALTARQWNLIDGLSVPSGITSFSGTMGVNTTGVYLGTTFTPGTFIMVHGGGHGDSSNNAMYAIGPFESETPAVHQISSNTSASDGGVGSVYFVADYPISDHSYDIGVWIASKNWVVKPGFGATYLNANQGGPYIIFDCTISNPTVNNPWTAGSNVTSNPQESLSAYDPSTGKAWFTTSGGHILSALPGVGTSMTWTDHGTLWSGFGGCSADIWPDQQLFVAARGSGQVSMFHLGSYPETSPSVLYGHWEVTPSGTPFNNAALSTVWVPPENAFAVASMAPSSGDDRRTVRWLRNAVDPTSPTSTNWTFTEETASGTTPGPSNTGDVGAGAYSRFDYLPGIFNALYYIDKDGLLYIRPL